MNTLNHTALNDEQLERYNAVRSSPIRVLQIGEGNFMRGFFDWMIHESRKKGLFDGGVAVVQPRLQGKAKMNKLIAQEGLYHLVIRGLEQGAPVNRTEVITALTEAFDPYTEWERFTALAALPELRIVVSNTTEAGLVYRPEPLGEGPLEAFPAKIAYLLYLRYQAFQGSPEHGLLILPCELLERNGDTLLEAVLQYAKDWKLPADFSRWAAGHNRFLNNLVDRIVTGYPAEDQAEALFADWGVRDELLCAAEPYHIWAIEGEPGLDELLPFARAGLNVHWTNDLKPFRERKVRLLNGAHSWMAPLAMVHGVTYVREIMEHPVWGAAVRDVVLKELLPTLPGNAEELKAYAGDVFDRFANPYLDHRLSDIAMNSLSKFRTRLLPAFDYYRQQNLPLPAHLSTGLAGLLRYLKIRQTADGDVEGAEGTRGTGNIGAAEGNGDTGGTGAGEDTSVIGGTIRTGVAEDTRGSGGIGAEGGTGAAGGPGSTGARGAAAAGGTNGFEGRRLDGSIYTVQDDEEQLRMVADIWEKAEAGEWPLEETVVLLLEQHALWGTRLNEWSGLAESVTAQIRQWEKGAVSL